MTSLIIPQSGRTFENFMQKIKDKVVESDDIDETINIIKKGKKNKSPNIADVLDFLNQYQTKLYPLGVFVDRKRVERPYRVGFLGKDFQLKDIKTTIRVEGAEPHNCSALVSLGEADLAVAGFDELLTITQEKLVNPSTVTKWGAYNYNLNKSKKVRVAGSAMIDAYTNMNQIITDLLLSTPEVASNDTQLDNVKVYPNPTTGIVKIQNVENATINVYSLTGNLVETIVSNTVNTTINLSDLAKGTYLVQIVNENEVVTKKITLVK
jgi:hypothetical protein